ncbi:ABC transporter permease [Paraburkholderia bonniea]|uniref:ABC transporter permease n=1 Tax=Paraburkholderia bonniea TaxID=2152891 RepID=UPI001C2C1ADF|nr:ABC transporter permease [Paraburkholderia bonniea]
MADIRESVAGWRVWYTLAMNDVRRRYRRSRLGQFWLTLSMALTVGGLGIVYSTLFKTDVATYLPYISVTFVFWGLITSGIVESCSSFIESEGLIRHTTIPRATHLLRTQLRTIIIAAHNVIIVPLVFIALRYPINWNIFYFIPGLILVLANIFWIGYFLAICSARFRDVPQIVASVMQLVFFITPVMFRTSQLGNHGYVLLFNPFAHLLQVVRDPLLGLPPDILSLSVCLVMAVIGNLIVVPFAGRYAARVVYWL